MDILSRSAENVKTIMGMEAFCVTGMWQDPVNE